MTGTLTRRHFLMLCAALAGAAANGCSGGANRPDADGFVDVVDCVGRQVRVPANPQRVSGLDSFVGELMVMIGAGPLLVGTPAGVVSDVMLCELFPGLKAVSAPMTSGTINIEEFMATAPQVALIKRDVFETSGEAQKLDATKVPYVVVGYTSMAEQIAAMRLVGAVCGGRYEAAAEALAAFYEKVVADCAARVADIPLDRRPRVYHSINALTMTDGTTSLGADWVNAAGGVDVSARDPQAATATDYVTTLEQIYTWDPDVFVCNSADTTDYLLAKDNCAGLRAVKAGRVHTIPVGATRWGQRGSVETYLAVLWLGTILYPERYADADLQTAVTDYYRDYLGIEVTDERYAMMLSGRGLRQASTQAQNQ